MEWFFEDSIVTPKFTQFTGILACLILQVKTLPKIANYENIPKSKTSNSDFYKGLM